MALGLIRHVRYKEKSRQSCYFSTHDRGVRYRQRQERKHNRDGDQSKRVLLPFLRSKNSRR
jgi:hypothetical protein